MTVTAAAVGLINDLHTDVGDGVPQRRCCRLTDDAARGKGGGGSGGGGGADAIHLHGQSDNHRYYPTGALAAISRVRSYGGRSAAATCGATLPADRSPAPGRHFPALVTRCRLVLPGPGGGSTQWPVLPFQRDTT